MIDIPKKLTDNLVFVINQTSKDQIGQFDEQMRALNLDKAQWRILGYLVYFKNINQSELAKLLGMGKAPLGQLIHKLEQAGWVERRPSSTDRRSYNLKLTEKVVDVAELVSKLMELEVDRLLTDLDERDIRAVERAMRIIRHNIMAIRSSEEIEALKAMLADKMAKLELGR